MSFYQQLKKYPIRTLKTALIALIDLGLGIFISIVSLSILDLQILTGSSITEAAMLLPIRTIGYILGTTLIGIVGDKLCHQIVMMLSLFVILIGSFFLPFFSSIVIMYVIILITGFANACINTVEDLWILHMWVCIRKKVMYNKKEDHKQKN